jgi:hypothetical protein
MEMRKGAGGCELFELSQKRTIPIRVMAGLVPAIHVLLVASLERRGCRHKAGHDEVH